MSPLISLLALASLLAAARAGSYTYFTGSDTAIYHKLHTFQLSSHGGEIEVQRNYCGAPDFDPIGTKVECVNGASDCDPYISLRNYWYKVKVECNPSKTCDCKEPIEYCGAPDFDPIGTKVECVNGASDCDPYISLRNYWYKVKVECNPSKTCDCKEPIEVNITQFC